VITDTSANIRRIVEIVSAMDASEAGAAEVKVFQLEYASASAAARLVNDLFGDQSRSSSSRTSGGFGDFASRFGFFARRASATSAAAGTHGKVRTSSSNRHGSRCA